MRAIPTHPARYKRTLLAELLLLTEVQFFIILAKWPANAERTLLLDGALLFVGVFATALFLARKANGWLLLCGIAPIIAGLVQLFWSFGAEGTVLTFISILIVADMIANPILLSISLWKRGHPLHGKN